ncbi:MAG: DUF3473 domain-containing protein [Anaeromicrobium sp.]|jgi:polysaccharide deacetylase family protein (PEP-CTERM system associated)|uniref:XrtA system polysaccharide deacetylase n=1 Tax=Anaeromicrobium sp. TaxID=1929132 RepID=UPI0025EB8834|nr:XrtA system polysaccharide deacetylase [Anaeromicrobium sp.]MCT4593974.1 DUF3473 domain-containing protein [Anaeromicrobium sp.]
MIIKNFFTVDVEDWFQVENLKEVILVDDWEKNKLRVKNSTNRILKLLDKTNTKATFFILGWIAERVPDLVLEIYKRGHEVASHGYGHQLVYNLSKQEFTNDLKKSKDILENIINDRIYGYRAPSFSITEWSLDVLKEEGFLYDSSMFLVSGHDRYSKLNINLNGGGAIKELDNGIKEICISTNSVLGKKLPWGGGGYFRLIPYGIFKRGFKRSIRQNDGGVFYCHPWEIDADQPTVDNIRPSYRFRHYYGLEQTEKKLEGLLTDFKFGRIKDHIL